MSDGSVENYNAFKAMDYLEFFLYMQQNEKKYKKNG
jgi:hypothetical protein